MKYLLLQLKNSIWYRLLKIVYIIVFVIFIALGIYLLLSINKGYYDENATRITCVNSLDNTTYYSINLSDYKISNKEYDEEKIAKEICDYDDISITVNLSKSVAKDHVILQTYLSDQSIGKEKRQNILNAIASGQDTSELADILITKYREFTKTTNKISGISFGKLIKEIYSYNDLIISNNLFLVYKGAYFESVNWINFLSDLVFFIVILTIIAELIRRIFYYILTGYFNPKYT